MLLTPGEAGYAQEEQGTATADTVIVQQYSAGESEVEPQAEAEADTAASEEADEEVNGGISQVARQEAVGAVQRLWRSFYSNLPKILVALGILVAAWLFARLVRWLLGRLVKRWERAGATIAITNIIIWLFAIGVAISVLVGDIRAMVGSLGLIGLALSWSLQTPIESFTGWLFNSFKGYYRIGDRISVGDVVGDVYKIDFLTTTVWEIGSSYRQSYLEAEQPTGRLVTFPNNEVLAGSVVNYTSDFPYVWDELIVGVANESDIRLSMQVLERVATELLSDYMREPAQQYSRILQKAGLEFPVSDTPQVFLSTTDSWTNVIIRYLVGARERRKWKTELILRTAEETAKPEYKDKIIPVYTRQQIQLLDIEGTPVELDSYRDDDE
ncbi:Small-conductance mechanosensitive channel [Cesiribacter andamanensis AMV16]|uniref:Small-conductance mechanosensitive channel n=2 Tax=Cesiribacter TaxID=1133570 RepID=M7NXM9_9BACT|nr:Small-conductance mechanosensitive channel [Cesiribacter andamanensis AMV16]